jgi:Xaa-Pro aminopeptidase
MLAMKGMRCATELMEIGRTELEIAAEIEYEMRKAGSEGTPFNTIVASGKNSWIPHATATRKRLQRGELVIVDLGAIYKGYASDITRTFALEPTRKQLKLIEVVKRAQRMAFAKIKDDLKANEVDRIARRTITLAGYAKFYPHGTGHGVGLEVHEPPSLTPESKDILRRGMVLTIEPGIYVPSVGGARFEDMILVTKDGKEVLTSD